MSEKQVVITEKSDLTIRLVSILGAVTCILAGVLLALSIGAAIFGWTFINSGPGSLLGGAYGTLAFIIPLYLFGAAWLLFDPVFRPGRVFLLAAALLPFLTLALGFSLIRDFEERRLELAFLDAMGRNGLGILVITAAVLECVGILILKKVLFSRERTLSGTVKPIPPEPAQAESVSAAGSGAVIDTDSAAEPEHYSAQNTSDTADKNDRPGSEAYQLPDWEPLKSTAAYQELEKNKNEEILVLDNAAFSPYSKLGGDPFKDSDFYEEKISKTLAGESVNGESANIEDFEEVETLEELPGFDESDTADQFDRFDPTDQFGEPDKPLLFDEGADLEISAVPDTFAEHEEEVIGPVEENNYHELEQVRFDQFDGGEADGIQSDAEQSNTVNGSGKSPVPRIPQTIKKKTE